VRYLVIDARIEVPRIDKRQWGQIRGIAVSSVPLPKVTATVAAGQPGAITYGIRQGTAIPAALAKILSKFDPPKKSEPPPPPPLKKKKAINKEMLND
jgi:hypothetical protein